MKTIKITRDFTGVRNWPKEGAPETFTIGQVVTVPKAFADRVVERGAAREVEPDTAEEASSESPRAATKRGEEASEAKRSSRRSE